VVMTTHEHRTVIDVVLAARRAESVAATVVDISRYADSRPIAVRRDAITTLLAWNGESVTDLAVAPIDEEQGARLSNARVRAMELGLSPWPSASGWAPMDLPWKERRILIGIVEGVASLARWAHEIWLRDHQPFAECCDCGDPVCSESCPP
jgi:hypothetical protein